MNINKINELNKHNLNDGYYDYHTGYVLSNEKDKLSEHYMIEGFYGQNLESKK